MKKTVIIFGLITGTLITTMMLIGANMCYYQGEDFKPNDILGYTALLIAFSFIFIGIKNYRDRFNNGVITFGRAFKTGFYLSLIASTLYVVVWLIDYYLFIPDFLDKYIAHVLREAKADGATATEIADKTKEMANFKEMYKNPLFIIVTTYLEVLPIGVVVSLISAAILKRKDEGGKNKS
jgi:hypothetical protein